MRRLLLVIATATAALLAAAPAALAQASGEGLYGEVDDKVTTNAGFIVIFAIPLFLLLMTLLQAKLEKRKAARIENAKASESDGRWNGGW